jgi:transcriptional regulator with XRE-family HTH domain
MTAAERARLDRESLRDDLGHRLRAAREQKNIGLRELARRLGVSASLISQIETGKTEPSINTLFAIVSELELSVNEIVFEAREASRASSGKLESRADDGPAARDRPPVSESTPPQSLMRHNGTEYGYILRGRLQVSIGFDTYEIGPGDSIAFDCTQPHRFSTVGDEAVEAVWFVVGRRNTLSVDDSSIAP